MRSHRTETDFWPIYEAASSLRVPLYIHPQSPQVEVRAASYDGLSSPRGQYRTCDGWFRLALPDRTTGDSLDPLGRARSFRDLELMLGHWGEVILFYLARIAATFAADNAATALHARDFRKVFYSSDRF